MSLNVGSIATGVVSNLLGGNTKGTAISSAASKLFSGNLINNLVPINKSGNDYIEFPSSLLSRSDVSQYTYFKCYAEEQPGWETNKKITNLGSVFLPLPRDLSSSYKSGWSSAEGGVAATIPDTAENISNAEGIRAKFQAGIGGTGEYAGKSMVHGAMGVGGPAYEHFTKETMNPMNLLNWKAPDFRSFSFNWLLVPNSAEEAETLNEILYWMKRYIHTPSAPDSATLKYPPLWDIKFVDSTGINSKKGNKFLFETKKCAITDITIDYNSIGNAYHRANKDGLGHHAPNGIKLTVSFTETVIITQNDYKSSYTNIATP
jgi:hypothetical protein